MLASSAATSEYSLATLWQQRRQAAASADAAATTAVGGRAEPVLPPAASVRRVTVAALTPVVLSTLLSTTADALLRIDGVDVVAGDVVLCTAQADARENGPWIVGGAGADARDLFVGLLLRVQGGDVARGWLFVCVAYSAAAGTAAFAAVRSPVPSKADVDALRVDAATVRGTVPPAASAGGDVGLVVAVGDAPPLLRGVTAGLGVGVRGTDREVVVSAPAPVRCCWRPADVVFCDSVGLRLATGGTVLRYRHASAGEGEARFGLVAVPVPAGTYGAEVVLALRAGGPAAVTATVRLVGTLGAVLWDGVAVTSAPTAAVTPTDPAWPQWSCADGVARPALVWTDADATASGLALRVSAPGPVDIVCLHVVLHP